MEYTALAKSVRISPRKVSLVVDAMRGQRLVEAWIDSLVLVRKRGADAIEKTLKSAVANAVNKGARKENLIVKSVEVSPGPAFKRYHPSTRGRIHPYKKRSSHIRIILTDDKSQISNLKSQTKEEKIPEVREAGKKSKAKGAKHGTKS